MKHLIYITLTILLLGPSIGFAQQDTTQYEQSKTEVRKLDDFHGIKVIGNVQATLKKGETPSIKLIEWGIEADISKVSTTVKGGELKVENIAAGEKKEVVVIITYTDIDELVADAGGNIAKTDQIENKFLKIKVAKGSLAHINIKANTLTLDVTNGSEAYIKGSCDNAVVKVNNGSKFRGYKLVCQEMEVSSISGAIAEVQAVERLEAKASLKAKVIYLGYPTKLMPKVSAGGTVERKE